MKEAMNSLVRMRLDDVLDNLAVTDIRQSITLFYTGEKGRP